MKTIDTRMYEAYKAEAAQQNAIKFGNYVVGNEGAIMFPVLYKRHFFVVTTTEDSKDKFLVKIHSDEARTSSYLFGDLNEKGQLNKLQGCLELLLASF